MSDFLKQHIETMGIEINDQQVSQLEHMLDLLAEWNEKHNLTRIKDRQAQEIYHIFDALSGYQYFTAYCTILDVGTGAGFPGIPLAIMYTDKNFHLVDANGKKIAYLRQLIKHLNLTNVKVYHSRIESLAIENVDCVTARAVADPGVIISLTQKFQPRDYLLYVGPNCPKVNNELREEITVPLSEKQHFMLKVPG